MWKLAGHGICLAALITGVATTPPLALAEYKPLGKHELALEVARLAVDRENYSTEPLERAGRIPDEALDAIQHALVGTATRGGAFQAVRKSDQEAPADFPSVVLSGTVLDYKPGSRSARMLIGMGAGAQKFVAECVLTDKATGKVLGKETISDKKWGGIAGGSEDKGLHDFAEKVLNFVEGALASK